MRLFPSFSVSASVVLWRICRLQFVPLVFYQTVVSLKEKEKARWPVNNTHLCSDFPNPVGQKWYMPSDYCDSTAMLIHERHKLGLRDLHAHFRALHFPLTHSTDMQVRWIWHPELPRGMNTRVRLTISCIICTINWQLSKLTSSFPSCSNIQQQENKTSESAAMRAALTPQQCFEINANKQKKGQGVIIVWGPWMLIYSSLDQSGGLTDLNE